MRITPDDLKNTGLKKVQIRERPSKPATAGNELSAMLLRFNRNRNDDEEKGSESPTLTRTVRGLTIRRTIRRKGSSEKQFRALGAPWQALLK